MLLILPWLLMAAVAVTPVPHHQPKPNQLDQLFTDLSKTSSAEEAQPIENRITALFESSNSATVNILMQRAATTLKMDDVDTTRKLVYAITTIAPNYAEGWHRRAILEEAANDDADALVSLQKTIALNPRQFEALAEMGRILEDYGDGKAALASYRKALALDPHMEGIDKHAAELAREVEGEKI